MTTYMAESILDYYFEPGDFALFVGINKEGEEAHVRVKILGTIMENGDKYYVIAGPRSLLEELGGDILDEDVSDIPTGWAQSIADPDELELCKRNSHLRLV